MFATLGATAIELMPVAAISPASGIGATTACAFTRRPTPTGIPDDLRGAGGCGARAGSGGHPGRRLQPPRARTAITSGVYAPGYIDEERKTPWGGALRFDDPRIPPAARPLCVESAVLARRIPHRRLPARRDARDPGRIAPPYPRGDRPPPIHEHGGVRHRRGFAQRIAAHPSGRGKRARLRCASGRTISTTRCASSNTHENEGYLGDFYWQRSTEIVETLRNGWFYRGQYSRHKGGKRGTECRHHPPRKFVHCISNHDQVGNRALGERLNHVDQPRGLPGGLRAALPDAIYAAAFHGPGMGGIDPVPFLHRSQRGAGQARHQGPARGIQGFRRVQRARARGAQSPIRRMPKTFLDSKLVWDEVRDEKKSRTLDLYRACLGLRRREAAFRPETRETWYVEALEMGVGALRFKGATSDWLLLFDIEGGHNGSLAEEWICKPRGPRGWAVVLSTNEKQFGGTGRMRVRCRGQPCALQPAGAGALKIMSRSSIPSATYRLQFNKDFTFARAAALADYFASWAFPTSTRRPISRRRPEARTGTT